MTKHTPGTWTTTGVEVESHQSGMSLILADVSDVPGGWGGNRVANARLMAAAPDLLIACEALVALQRLPGCAELANAAALARYAIAKATGEASS